MSKAKVDQPLELFGPAGPSGGNLVGGDRDRKKTRDTSKDCNLSVLIMNTRSFIGNLSGTPPAAVLRMLAYDDHVFAARVSHALLHISGFRNGKGEWIQKWKGRIGALNASAITISHDHMLVARQELPAIWHRS